MLEPLHPLMSGPGNVCGKRDGPTRAAWRVVLSYKYTITIQLGININTTINIQVSKE